MPELPEVETVVRDLNKNILGQKIEDVWSDHKKTVKKPENFKEFKKKLKGKKIKKIWRRGKNIIFDLSEGLNLLIHQKLTGHLLVGKWQLKKGKWQAKTPGPLLKDPMNRFLHLMFWLDDGRMLALSDLRKFAKVELLDRKNLEKELSFLGPEPLKKNFTFKKFKEILKKKKGKIKKVLLDQKIIAGIGNIYSDEILWQAKINPFKDASKLSNFEFTAIYKAMKKILKKAIKCGGESFSDFRRPSGEKGNFDPFRMVYRRKGEDCRRCEKKIERVKIGGRSAHFCPFCQKTNKKTSSILL